MDGGAAGAGSGELRVRPDDLGVLAHRIDRAREQVAEAESRVRRLRRVRPALADGSTAGLLNAAVSRLLADIDALEGALEREAASLRIAARRYAATDRAIGANCR